MQLNLVLIVTFLLLKNRWKAKVVPIEAGHVIRNRRGDNAHTLPAFAGDGPCWGVQSIRKLQSDVDTGKLTLNVIIMDTELMCCLWSEETCEPVSTGVVPDFSGPVECFQFYLRSTLVSWLKNRLQHMFIFMSALCENRLTKVYLIIPSWPLLWVLYAIDWLCL